MKRSLTVLLSILLGAFLVAPPAQAADAPYCGITWGSLPKQAGPRQAMPVDGDIKNVRTGQHECYDRLVIDVDGPATGGYDVRYISNEYIGLRGGIVLHIVASVPSRDDLGRWTYNPTDMSELTDVSNYRTFRQLVGENPQPDHTQILLGVRARLPFRVFTLDGPGSGSRIVIDVAHYWTAPTTASTAPATSTPAASPYCGITWGSLAKQSALWSGNEPLEGAAPISAAPIVNVRTGRHDCYDRLVFDIQGGPVGGYRVQYDPDQQVAYFGDPALIPRGGAYLLIELNHPVTTGTDPVVRTFAPANLEELSDVASYRTFRQVEELIYIPGTVTAFTLGLRARLPFRVFTLDGPGSGSRLVIDVAHRW